MLVNRLPFIIGFRMTEANWTCDRLGRFIGLETEVKLLFSVSLFTVA